MATRIHGETFTTKVSYDSVGRVFEVDYPEGGGPFRVRNDYNYGAVSGVSAPGIIWQRQKSDASNRTIEETFGNGLVTYRGYDNTGRTGRKYAVFSRKMNVSLKGPPRT